MKKIFALVVLLGISAMSQAFATKASPFMKPETSVKYRQAIFTVLSTQMGYLSAMLKGSIPFDAEGAQSGAAIIDAAAQWALPAFPPGSQDTKIDKAKLEATTASEDFKALFARLKKETNKLPAAAGKQETLRAQLGEVANVCKTCHEKYKDK